MIDEQKLLQEHYEILADIKSIKQDVIEGKSGSVELLKKIEVLEKRAFRNDVDHLQFVKAQDLAEIRDSLRQMRDGMLVMTPKQAKDAGNGFLAVILKNPTHLMWIILGVVVIIMVIQGYNFIEISQVLDRIK